MKRKPKRLEVAPENWHEKTSLALGELKGEVKTGFKNTNERLDKLNGKVAEHEIYVQRSKGRQAIYGSSLTILAVLLGWILNKIF